MKKLIALLIVLLLPAFAAAEVDLGSMSIQELNNLQRNVIKAIQATSTAEKGTKENPLVMKESGVTNKYSDDVITVQFVAETKAGEASKRLIDKAIYDWEYDDPNEVDILQFMLTYNKASDWSDSLSCYDSSFFAYDSNFIAIELPSAKAMSEIAEGTSGYKYIAVYPEDDITYIVYENRLWFKIK